MDEPEGVALCAVLDCPQDRAKSNRSGFVYSYCRDHHNEIVRRKRGVAAEDARGQREALPMPAIRQMPYYEMPDVREPMSPLMRLVSNEMLAKLRGN